MVKSQLGSSKVSDFVELVLQRSKFSNITENREQREKKERMGLQRDDIQLDQVVNSKLQKENISKKRLTAQSQSMVGDMVS